ncbi:MAG: SPFH domain-containing protein [Clostridiaceae bacterium]|nr:SPFH domain-containing protein [Clostridiaceae bacterium]
MLGFRFIKFQPSEFVLKYKNGKVVKAGSGIAFYYYVPTTSIVVVPLGSIDEPFIFEGLTLDYQTVTIQGQVTYRIIDQSKVCNLLNYTLNNNGKGYASDDPKKLTQRVINIVKVSTKKHLESLQLRDAIKSTENIAQAMISEIKESEEVKLLGIEIFGLSILNILPNKETSRALEAQAREQILKMADEAVYERRNASIEQERRVKENELNTEIAVENKKRQIKETQLETQKVVKQKENELKDENMNFEISLEGKRKELIDKTVENEKAEADAKAYELSTVMKVLDGINPTVIKALSSMGMKPDKLIAIAFQELAVNANKIGQLNITPDLLQEIIKGQDNYE